MTRDEIKAILPHREPMLLIDSVTVDETGQAVGEYTIPESAFYIQGHFPQNPVVPGVILCEIMAQACCVLFAESIKGHTPYYTGLDNVRFRKKVFPGDTLTITCRVIKEKPPFYFVSGKIEVGGKPAVTGELSFAVG